jgi:uncharacterized protein YijF (DUF1287 family)
MKLSSRDSVARVHRITVLLSLALLVSSSQSISAQSSNQLFLSRLISAAHERTTHSVRYEPAYVRIAYPNGDVPSDTGVCTDEIIRIYRTVGIDLQKLVHEDMQQNRAAYPRFGNYNGTDTNIDHRRVPNLMVFFARKGKSLPITNRIEDYAPGDLVTWDLGGNVPHIGILVDTKSPQSGRYMIVHNIGRGPKMEDVLFDWKITGHYEYLGPKN